MPFLEITSSPLAPGVSPVGIYYRDVGPPAREPLSGPPIVFLHSGWGYEIYPFDRQIAELASQYRIVIPDRTGYGGSGRVEKLPTDFHRRAMEEMWAIVDALELDRPVLWGHSDGAIIALLMALEAPDRVRGTIVEAAHFLKRKPASHDFFERLLENPRALGATATSVLARDHGEGWPRVVELHCRAWLQIGNEASATEDFYDGRIGKIETPVLIVHGARDPRTEPAEIDMLRASLDLGVAGLRHSSIVLPGGWHSPHSERATADDVTRAALQFIRSTSDEAPDPATPQRDQREGGSAPP